jgi:hypothetical protein
MRSPRGLTAFRHRSSASAIFFAVVLATGAVAHNEQPQVLPARDVDITYQITRPGQPATPERQRWSAGGQLQRIDGPDKAATIFDRKRNEFTLINRRSKTYRVFEGAPRTPSAPGNGEVLQRGGEATIAKLHCVDWSWTVDTEIHTTCLTPDGVMLRLSIDGKTVMQARSVDFFQQPAAIFQVPRGYQPAIAPEGGPSP